MGMCVLPVVQLFTGVEYTYEKSVIVVGFFFF